LLHAFLTLAVEGSEWSTSRLSFLAPEPALMFWRRKSLCPLLGLEPQLAKPIP